MARSEARLLNEIWDDDDFIKLPPTAQRAFMFLLSQDDLAHDGVIALRLKRWARKAAGLTARDLEHDLDTLEAARFLVIDWDTEEVLIRSLIRRDKVYRQPNVMRAAIDHIPLVESTAILRALTAEVTRIRAENPDLTTAQDATLTGMEKALAGRVPPETPPSSVRPSRNPTDKGSGKGSGNPSEKTTAKGPRGTGSVTEVSTDSPLPESPNPTPAASRERARDDPPPDDEPAGETERIVAKWVRSLKKPPQTKVVNAVGTVVREALSDGQDPDDIDEALTLWQRKGNLGPNALPSLIHEIANRHPSNVLALPASRASPARESTTDARVRQGAALTAQLEAWEAGT